MLAYALIRAYSQKIRRQYEKLLYAGEYMHLWRSGYALVCKTRNMGSNPILCEMYLVYGVLAELANCT